MMQEHPYFARPMIFYGTLQQNNEDEMNEEDEMNFSDLIHISREQLSMNIPRVELMFHWSDSESEIHFS